ncbi:MAG TPA: PilZ domain-containing protein [Pyrinomonadaceae bacterium]|nr:PilZ domain-containing protein [Pyrinomonadaceae bacterium]
MYEQLRKHPRISLRTELWIGQDGIFTRTDETLRDLSIGGAYIESRQAPPIGSIVNVRFRLPVSPTLVSCSAIVRSATVGEGFGVQFLDISRENVHIIERQVAGESARAQIRF